MADMREYGSMDLNNRGGTHEYLYDDGRDVAASHGPTPSQTVGPFFAYGLTPGSYGYAMRDIHSNTLGTDDISGERVIIDGHVFDGEGLAVHDALIEIVQADSTGKYVSEPRNDGFTGYGRFGTGANGRAESGGDTRFRFHTIKPGATATDQAPFVTVIVTMRGLLNHMVTRIYFPDDALDTDAVLIQVPESRRHTLVAKPVGIGHYRFDIHMQGDQETVFFDV